MFIIVQVPFIDLRLVKNEKYEDCIFPNDWNRNPFYYRYFGHKDNRNVDHEQSFFKTKRKIFTSLMCDNIKSKIIYTRLFNETFFFHFDIAIKVNTNDSQINPLSIINDIINKGKLYVPSFEDKLLPFNQKKFQQCIANLYLYATTKKAKGYPRPSTNEETLYFGTPAILLYESHTKIKETKDIKIVNKMYDIIVYKTMLKSQLYPAHLWILESNYNNGDTDDRLRNYRICLLKMHSYREGLKNLFDFFRKYPVNPDKIRVIKDEFKYLLDRLKKPKLYGIDSKCIMDYAIENDKASFCETWERLIILLQEYYDEIKEITKGEKVMVDNRGGIIIQGGNGQNTINIGNITQNNGIDLSQLETLIGAVKNSISNDIPKEDIEIIKKNLENLNTLLTQPKPEKSKLEIILTSIEKIAETIGSATKFGTAIAALIKFIKPLLLLL